MIIWLASYPRSGNTYLRTILNHCFALDTYSLYDDTHDIAANLRTAEVVGHLSHGKTQQDFVALANESSQSYFVKTHELPTDGSKAIYVIREGLATSVSYKNYLQNFGAQKDLSDVIIGNVDFGAWSFHVDSWRNRVGPILFVRYESLIENLNDTLDQISLFLDRPIVSRAVPSFKELHAVDPRFFRTGNNLANVQEADSSDRLFFEIIAGRLNRALGYPAHAEIPKSLSDIVDKLSSSLNDMFLQRETIRSSRDKFLEESIDLKADRGAKAEVIERLSADMAGLDADRGALRQANQKLASANEALEADRGAKAEVIERLLAELENTRIERDAIIEVGEGLRNEANILSISLGAHTTKISAKDEVIKNFAGRELERKALLGGTSDLALLWRRKYPLPSYGEFISSGVQSPGLHVAIDALEIVFGVSGGVETYMKMLVSALIGSGSRITIICLPSQIASLQREFQDRVSYFIMRVSRAMDFSIRTINRIPGRNARISASTSMATFSRLAEDIGADVLHSPVQIFSNLDFRVPAVLNLHDLQHLHFPENFKPSDIDARNYLYSLSANLADAIIVSSDFVSNDLVSRMNIPQSKVFMVPVTWNPMVENGLESFSAEQARLHYKLPPNYALYPAQFWPHKNHVRLVEALKIVRDRMPKQDLKLVLTGYRGHSGWPKVEDAIKRCDLASHVICLDHVPVEHLAALYKASTYCVMPSTFEASSYPVIEAQILGVPAMCSNVTSLPELMRDGAGLLFDPFDVEDIAGKMMHWLNAPDDRALHAQRASVKARSEHSLANYVAGISRVYNHVTK